jgi:hypothetical protein
MNFLCISSQHYIFHIPLLRQCLRICAMFSESMQGYKDRIYHLATIHQAGGPLLVHSPRLLIERIYSKFSKPRSSRILLQPKESQCRGDKGSVNMNAINTCVSTSPINILTCDLSPTLWCVSLSSLLTQKMLRLKWKH